MSHTSLSGAYTYLISHSYAEFRLANHSFDRVYVKQGKLSKHGCLPSTKVVLQQQKSARAKNENAAPVTHGTMY